jgi:hypothetical protein
MKKYILLACCYGSFPSIFYYVKYLEKLEVKLLNLVFINVPFLLFTRKGTGRTCQNQFFFTSIRYRSDTKTFRIALTMMIYITNFF